MLCPIFAETSDSLTAILVLLAGFIGTSATWLWNKWDGKSTKDKEEQKKEELTMIDHVKEMEARCIEENKELKDEIKGQNRKINKLIKHVMYLEGAMRSKRIKFHPYNEDETDEHDPLVDSEDYQPPKSSPGVHKKDKPHEQ